MPDSNIRILDMKKVKIEHGNPNRRKGWITIDVEGKPDIKHDLNNFPYQFKDKSVNIIEMNHVLEHLLEPKQVILELHRILLHGGEVRIKVPYGITTAGNPNHKHDFLPEWFYAFDHSGSPYNNRTIGNKFKVTITVLHGRIRFWKPYVIIAKMRKTSENPRNVNYASWEDEPFSLYLFMWFCSILQLPFKILEAIARYVYER